MIKRLFIATVTCALLPGGFLSAQTLKLSTLAPDGSQWVNEMRAGAKEIKEKTNGRVTVKLYAGGVMGNDNKVLRKIRIGQLSGGYFTATSLQDRYGDLNIYGLPLLYRSEDEVNFVRERLDDRLRVGLREAGFESFGFAGGGFARIMSNTPITTLSDLSRQKVWVPEGDVISYEAMKAMGLSPVTLPVTDVLTGLQSGLLDIIGSPPVGALVLQWHTKVKFVTDVPLLYAIGFVAIDNKAWSKLSAADQAVAAKVFADVNDRINRYNQADDVKALRALKSAGLKFVDLAPAELESWRARVMKANRTMSENGVFSGKLFDEVLTMLNEYRARQSVTVAEGAEY